MCRFTSHTCYSSEVHIFSFFSIWPLFFKQGRNVLASKFLNISVSFILYSTCPCSRVIYGIRQNNHDLWVVKLIAGSSSGARKFTYYIGEVFLEDMFLEDLFRYHLTWASVMSQWLLTSWSVSLSRTGSGLLYIEVQQSWPSTCI